MYLRCDMKLDELSRLQLTNSFVRKDNEQFLETHGSDQWQWHGSEEAGSVLLLYYWRPNVNLIYQVVLFLNLL